MNTSKHRLNVVDDKTIPKEGTTEVVAQPLVVWNMADAFLQDHEDIYKKNKATEWKIQQWTNQTEVCVHWLSKMLFILCQS